jgi:MFS family permease
LPVFAKNEAGVTERGIGIIFLVNTLVVVLAQFPLAKALEGRRRMLSLALMCVLWAGAWMLVCLGGLWLAAVAAALLFCVAAVVFGLGECFQGPVQGALVADLAPPRLRGRYMAVSTISWDIGFIVGPAIGGFVLQAEPLALWPLAAAVCLLAGAGAISLERSIPRELRLTPA